MWLIRMIDLQFQENFQSPASGINPFIRPYLHVTATAGTIQEMLFNFKGNPVGLHGTFNLKHKDLKLLS